MDDDYIETKAKYGDVLQRLGEEYFRLIHALSFCEEFLSREYWLHGDQPPAAVLGLHRMFFMSQDTALLCVARLFGERDDEWSFKSFDKKFSQFERFDAVKDEYDEWNFCRRDVEKSEWLANIVVYRHEKLAHNALEAGYRKKSHVRKLMAGAGGEFSVNWGEVFDGVRTTLDLLARILTLSGSYSMRSVPSGFGGSYVAASLYDVDREMTAARGCYSPILEPHFPL
ncbi:hypothetical protein DL237_17130 [Pseudooceanicola sediminis]|mgnify:CR=1 FL=1|uniref:Uncharacterized protein n=1 Tax=Pseudooceanicola sediminis TaxID=2211117 RepID=A0A399IY74_9RHOB|nr:hypothetical protein [Pseudooceanicola sediminis]KAA2312346.1 hypothetical protein E0K93_17370 [Puniceibacterium sp. HSS470]RII37397.1 hypothetical protein DL237_17130 [Pseudooceanicola sediminis]|tara:strand:- start:15058 stop:15738 length:681 start_codon:yes stop_codon:yes gene_type:complete